MNHRANHRAVPVCLVMLTAIVACNRGAEPKAASSAAEPAYAERYPSQLGALTARFAEDEHTAHENATKLSTYPAELKDPSWAHVAVVVELADRAGSSADFSSGMSEIEQVQSFYAAEREPIRQKVAGTAAYVVKQKKECEVDVYGPTANALDKAIEKQTKEWRKAHSPADRYIDDHADAIGKANVEKLGEQADRIALTSYVVRLRLPRTKSELDGMVADDSDVKQTLARTRVEAKAVLDDPAAPKAAKETAKARTEAVTRAEAGVDNEVAKARALSAEIERRVAALTDEYEKALAALESTIRSLADKQPKK